MANTNGGFTFGLCGGAGWIYGDGKGLVFVVGVGGRGGLFGGDDCENQAGLKSRKEKEEIMTTITTAVAKTQISVVDFGQLLARLGACAEAKQWAKGKDFATVWATCERADWLLWLVGKMADKKGWPTRKEVVLAACACAETALKFVPKGEDRPRKCIEIVRAWVRGEVDIEEVRQARRDAAAAAYAADAYADAAYAAAAAAYAADAYADAAYAAAAADARFKTLRELADLVRGTIDVSRVEV